MIGQKDPFLVWRFTKISRTTAHVFGKYALKDCMFEYKNFKIINFKRRNYR
jgi:hypothetical protein